MKATDITWDFDIIDAYEKLDEMDYKEAAKALGIPEQKYASMTTSERHDFAYDLWHHSPATLEEFMGVPSEVEIPNSFSKQDDEDGLIAEYISEKYGFCIEGYVLEA